MNNTEIEKHSFGRPASTGERVALVQSSTCHLIEDEARAVAAALKEKKRQKDG